ncbi:argininosuccinate lyase [Micromonospora sp. NPDC023956]|uniref:argininosuccinate lyase n=1 Tax=Micromonospora sp. NPDC023956 TaxID=3155722 RepID=UPI003411F3C7
MSGTGRLAGQLGRRSQRVVYGELSAARIEEELDLMVRVDRAHLVMLAERGIVAGELAATLLRCVDELAADRYRALVGRPAPRGLYLMYEGYLVERLGPDVGGVLHTGRSRNDLKATITSMRLRDRVLRLSEEAVRLEGVLLSRARAYRDVVMPVHTHFQAAMPITYGYYLLGVAEAVGRDVTALHTAAELDVCPLGAGAVAGTDLPIDTTRTARLLGFDRGPRHALDVVASRDVLLRILAAAAGLSVTLSRLATDLQLWSTEEFGFVTFPDRLVGGSSAMPQKRNAFLLEHVRAKAGESVGAWTAAAAVMKSAPFTNSIEVGTEAVGCGWPGLDAVEDAVLLGQVLVSGARPVEHRMRARVENGFTVATWLANRLVGSGVPFRSAHRMVGEAVRRAVEAGSTDLAKFGPPGWLDDLDLVELDAAEVVAGQRYGGGPGEFATVAERAAVLWAAHRGWHLSWLDRLTGADLALTAAVGEWLGESPDAGRRTVPEHGTDSRIEQS